MEVEYFCARHLIMSLNNYYSGLLLSERLKIAEKRQQTEHSGVDVPSVLIYYNSVCMKRWAQVRYFITSLFSER